MVTVFLLVSSASEQVLEQVLGLPLLSQWKLWNEKQDRFPLVTVCHEISVVVMSDGPWRVLPVSWVLWLVFLFVCFVEGLFSRNVCQCSQPCLAQWRVWTSHVCCCHLQDLFSCFCDWRRPSRQWLCGVCVLCVPP